MIHELNRTAGLSVLGRPEMCILSVAAKGFSVFELVDEMKARGFHIQAQLGYAPDHGPSFHLTILPYNLPLLEKWLSELKDCVEKVKAAPPSPLLAKARDLFSKLDFNSPAALDLGQLIAGLGLDLDGPPLRMADINELLNSLPKPVVEQLLIAYYNALA